MGSEALIREMRVVAVREPPGEPFVQVVFLESARFYRLSRERADFEDALGRLRRAEAEGRPIRVRLASADDDVLEAVGIGDDPPADG